MTSPSPWGPADPARSAGPGVTPEPGEERAPDRIAELAAAIRSIENGEGDPTLPKGDSVASGLSASHPGSIGADVRSRTRAPGRGRGTGSAPRDASMTPDESATPDDRELEQRARAVVLRKLTVRARTRSELADALSAAEIPDHVAEPVLERMAEVGLIDDSAFAQEWVSARQQRRSLSRRKLADELRRKGVAPQVVSEAVAEVDDSDEYESALALARRKAGALARHDAVTQRRRLAGALDRRGFSTEVVQRVLREVLDS